jgi:hypothetical protein
MTSRVNRAALALSVCAAELALAGCSSGSSGSTTTSSSAAASGTIAPGDLDAAKIKIMCQELVPVIGQMNKDRTSNAPGSADVINQALSEMPATTAQDKADAQAAAQKALTGKCD